MGIQGLIPFVKNASRDANVSEFSGCTVAIDTYCWLHKGAIACADKLACGKETDVYVKYCLKYVRMLLSKDIKPILVFDGCHLPAKAVTEIKRREDRVIAKERVVELLKLGKEKEAMSNMKRSVDITHAMALALIKECRKLNVDCIVAPYEADAQLAYLNIKNYAQLVITEDSDLILFGCTKVLFKMNDRGEGTLVEAARLPSVMMCPIEHYRFDKFRRMCILSGCDYLASLPGIGLVKARKFVSATQDSDFANALRKLPSFLNRWDLPMTDEYRQSFLIAEATFKHQFVYDPIERKMLRLTEPDNEEIELTLCVNAGKMLDPELAFQLALGNIEPFTLKKLDNWDPDHRDVGAKGTANHPSIWSKDFKKYLTETNPWVKKLNKIEPIIGVLQTRPRKKVVNLGSKYVPETQDESLSIETLTSMYCNEPVNKKQKINSEDDTQYIETYTQDVHNIAATETEIIRNLEKSPILKNRHTTFKKYLEKGSNMTLKKLSQFPRTVLDDSVTESKFFNTEPSKSGNKIENSITIEESPEKPILDFRLNIDTQCSQIDSSQKEISLKPKNCNKSPILPGTSSNTRNPFKLKIAQKDLEDEPMLENSQKENPVNSKMEKSFRSDQNNDISNINLKNRNPFRLRPLQSSENDSLLEDSQLQKSLSSKVDITSPRIDPNCLILDKNHAFMLKASQSSCDTGFSESIIENSCPDNVVISVDPEETKSYFFGTPSPPGTTVYQTKALTTAPRGSSKSYFDSSPPKASSQTSLNKLSPKHGIKKQTCRVPGLRKTASLPSNQPTLSKFGFQKR